MLVRYTESEQDGDTYIDLVIRIRANDIGTRISVSASDSGNRLATVDGKNSIEFVPADLTQEALDQTIEGETAPSESFENVVSPISPTNDLPHTAQAADGASDYDESLTASSTARIGTAEPIIGNDREYAGFERTRYTNGTANPEPRRIGASDPANEQIDVVDGGQSELNAHGAYVQSPAVSVSSHDEPTRPVDQTLRAETAEHAVHDDEPITLGDVFGVEERRLVARLFRVPKRARAIHAYIIGLFTSPEAQDGKELRANIVRALAASVVTSSIENEWQLVPETVREMLKKGDTIPSDIESVVILAELLMNEPFEPAIMDYLDSVRNSFLSLVNHEETDARQRVFTAANRLDEKFESIFAPLRVA